MTDSQINIFQLKKVMHDFVKERNWEAYHLPKELAIALSIEAKELLELFLFKNPNFNEMSAETPLREAIKDEIADVFAYLLSISNSLDIDISEAFIKKMEKNALKYPKEVFNGKYEKI